MRNASAGLIALLNSGTEFYVADVLTIVRSDGTIHRLTSWPVNVTVTSQYDSASHTFLAGGATFKRGRTKLIVGLEVDDLELTIMTDPTRDTVTIAGVARTWPYLAKNGLLDEATVMLERAFSATANSWTVGTLILFSGKMGPCDADRMNVYATVNSDLQLLELPMPRNIYQPGCIHALYDAGCTIVKASLTVTGTCGASTVSQTATGLAAPDGSYELGAITITSGVLAGQVRTIKRYASNVAYFSVPLPSSPAGLTFSMYPGCDKQQSTCSGKFGNLAHFRGFPYIPTPENAR